MMTLYENINSMEMKTVGAVVIIFLLLLIAGVEPNPGPSEMLVFRYQYLLFEVATTLLRKLFDIKVNNNLVQFLKTNPDSEKILNDLINNNIITKDQQRFLPPRDKSPNTANFDITLLVCLLRSICGLKNQEDPVWKKPANGDFSVEAEITRVKECRNYVVHIGTAHISESDFNLKWKTLCKILHRLNKFCSVPNLTEMINKASTEPLDHRIKLQYDNIQKAWHEAESLFEKGIVDIKLRQSAIMIAQSELKDGQSKLMDGQSKIKSALSDVQEQTKRRLDNFEQAYNSKKCIKSYTYDEIKEHLQQSYETGFRTLCVTPLFSEDYRMEMLTIYTQPTMKHVPYHRARQSEDCYDISSYEQVFCKEKTAFRNIFVTGDAGMGKTSFGQFMSLLWSKAKAIDCDTVGNERVRKDASFMRNFDFVFYVALKETEDKDVVTMIINEYFYTPSKDEFEETTKTIQQILRTQNCLVILDGLDEWRPDVGGNRNHSLPRKVTSDRCTYLTTCRPYRIETDRLKEEYIDHQLQITGFVHEEYIRKVIAYMNKLKNTDKNPEDFLRQISRMGDQSKIPLITAQLIDVWFKYDITNMSKAMIYVNIVEMLFERAKDEKQITFPLLTPTDVQFHESFSRFTYFQKYVSTLEKVCYLSFLLLFDAKKETLNLVFTKKQLMSKPYNICPEEIEFLCQLGIISKHKVIASSGEQEHMLSFLHQSYLKFFAAIFVSFFDKTGLFLESVKAISIRDIENYKNFLVLLSGISSQMTSLFFEKIHMEQEDQIDILRKKHFAFHDYKRSFDFLQSIILACCKEIRTEQNRTEQKEISVSDNSQCAIKLEDYNFENNDLNNFEVLKTLLSENKNNVKFVSTQQYLNEFATIKGLQYLQYSGLPHDELPCRHVYDDRFTNLILQNNSTLQSIRCHNFTVTSKLDLRSLRHLTLIHFLEIIIDHTILHDLMNYISNNDLLENIYLHKVVCEEHKECKLTLNLSDHSKLQRLTLDAIYLECNGIKNSSLESLFLENHAYASFWMPWKSAVMLKDPANTIKNSKLTHLSLDGCTIPQSEVNHVIDTIRSLLYIEYLKLKHLTIPDDASLQLHPNTDCNKSIFVSLSGVRMTEKCFHEFIDSIRNKSKVSVRMYKCYVPYNHLSDLNTNLYMLRYIRKFPSLSIRSDHSQGFGFETIK